MIDIICLKRKNGTLEPKYELGADELNAEYSNNEPVRGRFTRATQAVVASCEQSNLLHACFKLVADNRGDIPNLRTPALVKYSCKVGIDFRDLSLIILRPDGGVQFSYRSFAFDKLKGTERIRVIQEAFEWCTNILELTVDEMVAEAQSRMLSR